MDYSLQLQNPTAQEMVAYDDISCRSASTQSNTSKTLSDARLLGQARSKSSLPQTGCERDRRLWMRTGIRLIN